MNLLTPNTMADPVPPPLIDTLNILHSDCNVSDIASILILWYVLYIISIHSAIRFEASQFPLKAWNLPLI